MTFTSDNYGIIEDAFDRLWDSKSPADADYEWAFDAFRMFVYEEMLNRVMDGGDPLSVTGAEELLETLFYDALDMTGGC